MTQITTFMNVTFQPLVAKFAGVLAFQEDTSGMPHPSMEPDATDAMRVGKETPRDDPFGLLFNVTIDSAQDVVGRNVKTGIAGDFATITVTDFDPADDALVIEVADGNDVTVVRQTVVADGVLVVFDNGAKALLQGLTQAISASSILFIAPDGAAGNDSAECGDTKAPICSDTLIAMGVDTKQNANGAIRYHHGD